MSSPIEILQGEARPAPFLSAIINPIFGGFLGVSCAAFINFATKRPVWSGIQKHVLLGVGGFVCGKYVDGRRNEALAKRDAVLRHYIELHPEDFPAPERKMFKDVFTPWVPVR